MENIELPEGFEWCRKTSYDVQAELACYQITDDYPLLDGFEERMFNINGIETKFAVKSGFNVLEQNNWTTSPDRPFVLTGTVGEKWPVKPSNMSAYDVDSSTIGLKPVTISTKDPSAQEFLVAIYIPEGISVKIVPSWAFADDGTFDESQIMVANSESSLVSHNGGDYVVARHIPGQPEYMELPENQRNTREAVKLYSPRIINGSVMQTTYDHALTQHEIVTKYQHAELKR